MSGSLEVTPHRFVHLRLHSEYSVADSIIKVKPLIARARELGMAALALTDRANLFALVKFYQAALGAGIKPLVGVDLPLAGEPGERMRVTVLAMNQPGFRNLIALVSGAYVGCRERGKVTREQVHEALDMQSQRRVPLDLRARRPARAANFGKRPGRQFPRTEIHRYRCAHRLDGRAGRGDRRAEGEDAVDRVVAG